MYESVTPNPTGSLSGPYFLQDTGGTVTGTEGAHSQVYRGTGTGTEGHRYRYRANLTKMHEWTLVVQWYCYRYRGGTCTGTGPTVTGTDGPSHRYRQCCALPEVYWGRCHPTVLCTILYSTYKCTFVSFAECTVEKDWNMLKLPYLYVGHKRR